mgnify:CR=1 FL=1
MILLDTNILSELMRPAPDNGVVQWLDAQVAANIWISAVTVSEIRLGIAMMPDGERKERLGELAEAFMALPARQRFAFTTWGLRDTDSWLLRDGKDDGKDSPLLLDRDGRANPAFQAVAEAFQRRPSPVGRGLERTAA